MAAIHETREAWLTAAAAMMAATISEAVQGMTAAQLAVAFPGFERGVSFASVPASLRVACSNPSGGIRNSVRGEWVSPEVSADNTHEVWISPKVDDVPTVLIVLLHELMHATLEGWERGAQHGPRFWRLAKPLGFARPLTTATIATGPQGEVLRSNISRWADALGEYPHAGVNFAAHDAQRRRQTTRQLKAECLTDGCGFKVRMTRTWAQRATPLCPVCEGMGVHSRTVVVMAEGEDLCRLAGVQVSRNGEDDAEAVERSAVLRAEREERERQAAEAAERAAADQRREAAAREAAASQAAAQRAANARAAGLGEAADLGVVEGQGVQNRYGTPEATRERRAAQRAARPAASFEGVSEGAETVRHLIELALPGSLAKGDACDMNDVEDAVRRYCDRSGVQRIGRFTLVQALRAGALTSVVEVPAEAQPQEGPKRSARFANLELD